jgi:hypothetical protein
LLLLYINNLPVNIQAAKLVLFADNISLLVVEKDESALHQRIKKVMRELQYWFYKKSFHKQGKNNSSVISYLTETEIP